MALCPSGAPTGAAGPFGPGLGSQVHLGCAHSGERAVGALCPSGRPLTPRLQGSLWVQGLAPQAPEWGRQLPLLTVNRRGAEQDQGSGSPSRARWTVFPAFSAGRRHPSLVAGTAAVSRRNEGAVQVHADSAYSHANQVIMSVVPELPFLPAPAHLKCPERRSLSRDLCVLLQGLL